MIIFEKIQNFSEGPYAFPASLVFLSILVISLGLRNRKAVNDRINAFNKRLDRIAEDVARETKRGDFH